MSASNYLPLIAMGFHVVLFYYSAVLVTLLTPHRNGLATSLPNLDLLAGRNLCIVHGTLEILAPEQSWSATCLNAEEVRRLSLRMKLVGRGSVLKERPSVFPLA
jgi:hypothetical protein